MSCPVCQVHHLRLDPRDKMCHSVRSGTFGAGQSDHRTLWKDFNSSLRALLTDREALCLWESEGGVISQELEATGNSGVQGAALTVPHEVLCPDPFSFTSASLDS